MDIFIDFETYSESDLRTRGGSRYFRHPSTEVLCMAYAIDDGPVKLWIPGYPFPLGDIREAVMHAHNASFERGIWEHVCVKRYGWPPVRVGQWQCTAVRCAALALPRSLADAAKALGLDAQKDMVGKQVMMRLCKPKNGVRPEATAEDLETLYAYCVQDVETERAIYAATLPLLGSEQELYVADQLVNDVGIPIDRQLAEAAVRLETEAKAKLEERLQHITSGRVTAGREVEKMLAFLADLGVVLEDLRAATVTKALTKTKPGTIAHEVLRIRQDLARASTAKYQAMLDRADDDDRVRGCHLFHGAATGRWSGMGIQPQNFPRPTLKDPETAAELIRSGMPLAELEFWLGPVHQALPSCLRSAICAPEGSVLNAEDFSQIEARVLAWHAGQQDLLDLFASGQDVYVHQAAKTYGIPPEKVTKDQRTLGKVQVLALGYGMGADKFRATCAVYGIDVPPAEAQRLVRAYRDANPRIVNYWAAAEANLRTTIHKGVERSLSRGITCRKVTHGKNSWAQFVLPSGRAISYHNPRLVAAEENRPARIAYQGIRGPQETYGGKLVENIVQATASDLLRHALVELMAAGHRVVMHVHDEIVLENAPLAEVERIVSTGPRWSEGLPIGAEGYTARRYRK